MSKRSPRKPTRWMRFWRKVYALLRRLGLARHRLRHVSWVERQTKFPKDTRRLTPFPTTAEVVRAIERAATEGHGQ